LSGHPEPGRPERAARSDCGVFRHGGQGPPAASSETRAQFAHFDGCPLCSRTLARKLNRLLTGCTGQQEKAARSLLHLAERTVGDHHRLSPYTDARVRGSGLERLTHCEQTSVLQILAEAHHLAVHLTTFRIRAGASLSRWLDDQKRIRHDLASSSVAISARH